MPYTRAVTHKASKLPYRGMTVTAKNYEDVAKWAKAKATRKDVDGNGVVRNQRIFLGFLPSGNRVAYIGDVVLKNRWGNVTIVRRKIFQRFYEFTSK